MGLLDGLFGKGELESLRAEMARQTARADQALQELQTCEEKASSQEAALKALEETNAGLQAKVADLENQMLEKKHLLAKVESLESDLLQAWEKESATSAQSRKLSDELQQTQRTLEAFQSRLQEVTTTASDLKDENLRLSRENQELRSNQSQRERQFVDREARLQEKSQKVQQQQAELVTRQSELSAREKNWRLAIEPQLRRFEAHCTLEKRAEQVSQRELELAAKASALSQQELALEQLGISASRLEVQKKALDERAAELTERERKLVTERKELDQASRLMDQRSEELRKREVALAKFQKRIDQLEEEQEVLEKRKEKLDQKESRYQRDVEKTREAIAEERASLRALKSDIKRREDAVAEREREVSRERDHLQLYQQANATLREQLSATKRTLEDCLRSRARMNSTPGLRMGSRPAREDVEEDLAPLPPVDKPSLALRSNSPLTGAGYRVGSSGIGDEQERRELLDTFIATPLSRLPKVGDSEYMKLWGEANTRIRIRYVAYHIYWNIEFQGARETMDLARDHWLKDLRWLKRTYGGRLPVHHWPDIPRR